VYEPGYFAAFDSNNEFEKWAAIEVGDFKVIPEGMEALTLPKGLMLFFITRDQAMTTLFFNIFSTSGCLNQTIDWTTDLIFKS
jgi:hypothetical protein